LLLVGVTCRQTRVNQAQFSWIFRTCGSVRLIVLLIGRMKSTKEWRWCRSVHTTALTTTSLVCSAFYLYTDSNMRRFVHDFSLPSSRHYLSYDDCLEDERENYQNCSVLCCVRHLCTVVWTYIWAVLKDQFGLCLDSVFVHLFWFSILCVLLV